MMTGLDSLGRTNLWWCRLGVSWGGDGGGDGGGDAAMAGKGPAYQVALMKEFEADAAGSWNTFPSKLALALKAFTRQ